MVRRTKDEALVTRERILDAAEWCFRTFGVSSVTTLLIAKRAKCTRGAVYGHFPKRGDIFKAVIDRAQIPLLERLRAVSLMPPPVMPALRQCLHQCLSDIRENERLRNVLEILEFRCDFGGDQLPYRQRLQDDAERMMELLRHVLLRARGAGELMDVCPDSCASLIGFTLLGAVRFVLMAPAARESMHETVGGVGYGIRVDDNRTPIPVIAVNRLQLDSACLK